MESLKDGWEAAGAGCWTIVFTTAPPRTRRIAGQSKSGRLRGRLRFPVRAWVASIIAVPGAKQRRAVGIGQLVALFSSVGDRSAENVARTGWLIASPRRSPRRGCGGQFLHDGSGNSPTAWLGRPRDERGLRGSSPSRNIAPCGGSGSEYPQVQYRSLGPGRFDLCLAAN